jgi:hypothetical protein
MKIIKGDLILTEDTTFNEELKVEGNISGYFDLKVIGNLNCLDLTCRNLTCRNLNCRNIVYCEKLTRKSPDTKIKCKMLIENRSKLEVKEWK